MGGTDTTEESEPQVIPALQDRNVISIVLGDYHSAALTADGKLYTWGSFSAGALGLGEPETIFGRSNFASFNIEERSLDVPTEVRFDHGIKGRKDRFCLAVAAAGWHTGALVIDLEVSPPARMSLFSQLTPVISLMAENPTKRKFLSLNL
jgi:SCF-associated factor 1